MDIIKSDLRLEPPRLRKSHPTGCVLHWTGGVRGVLGVVGTLNRRGLGYHYVIETNGDTYELADPTTDVMYHAGEANEWSIGIALVGGVDADPDFTDLQYTAAFELIRTLDDVYGWNFTASDVYVETGQGSRKQGIWPHYLLKSTKLDPGRELMEYIRNRMAHTKEDGGKLDIDKVAMDLHQTIAILQHLSEYIEEQSKK